MKGLLLHGANHFEVSDSIPEPDPAPGWAVVKTAYCGICGSDMPRFFETGSYKSPMVIGHEFSGVVDQLVPGGRIPKGTPVAILPIIPCGVCEGCVQTGEPFHCSNYQFIGSRNDGGFAQYCAVKEENLFPLGDIPLKTGALIEIMAVALHTVRRSGYQNGASIVFGAGPIGLAVAMWLKYFKSDVTIVDVREESLTRARGMGFEKVYAFDAVPQGHYEFAFEASGAAPVLPRMVELLEHKGCITVVGRNDKATCFEAPVFEKLMRKELIVYGCWGYNLKGEDALIRQAFPKMPVEAMISHVIPLEESVEILKKMYRKELDYCKVLVQLN
jgi:threonine dehydrogenase-like Zn-dependent dehydrogenase